MTAGGEKGDQFSARTHTHTHEVSKEIWEELEGRTQGTFVQKTLYTCIKFSKWERQEKPSEWLAGCKSKFHNNSNFSLGDPLIVSCLYHVPMWLCAECHIANCSVKT